MVPFAPFFAPPPPVVSSFLSSSLPVPLPASVHPSYLLLPSVSFCRSVMLFILIPLSPTVKKKKQYLQLARSSSRSPPAG